jgi:hypothetical protein
MLPERATGPISTSHYGWDNLAQCAAFHSMGIDHGRFHVFVAQEFLDCADVMSPLKKGYGLLASGVRMSMLPGTLKPRGVDVPEERET